MPIAFVGIDVAMSVFQLHGADAEGRFVTGKRLRRDQLVPELAKLPPCVIGIEACTGAFFWQRQFENRTIVAVANKYLGLALSAHPAGQHRAFQPAASFVRAGFGGIDIYGGAFSFISREELFDLAKAIMQNASSYAFELALEILSPAGQEQMIKLRDLVQKLNAMNIDSCETGQLLSGSLWDEVDGSTQSVCKIVGTMSGRFTDAFSAQYG